jgi:cytoskeletal protein CcmA (bactofilin family)
MLSNFTTKRPGNRQTAVSAPSAPTHPPAPAPQIAPQPDAGARPAERSAPSVIARDLVVLGSLVCQGEVQVEGEVQGDIHCATVVIGEHGRVTGGIVSGEVVVRGQVMGSIRGKKVALQSSSRVDGEIYHQSLKIEPGAYFEGKSRRCEDPMAGIVRPEAPTPQASGAQAQTDPAANGTILSPRTIDA